KILPIILFFKKIKNFKLILEVEENYSAVWGENETKIEEENNNILKADKFIFVNDIFPKRIGVKLPYIICYGDYRNNLKENNNKTNLVEKEKITMVYAGLISDGVYPDIYLAVDAMLYLNNNYILKIIGYGEDSSIQNLINYIQGKGLSNRVIFDGMYKGVEYSNYLRCCDIGLNPRVLDNMLSNYTFPSKVLTYLSHGLPVVSTDIDCIKLSKIATAVSFSKQVLAESFADAIKEVNLEHDVTKILDDLDTDFKESLNGLLKNDTY
ncbi:MAG: glycosyltransferase, partial [Acinetobacter sp.]|nr:glycosyltransferase [Acinetobacter sp.]